MQLIDFYIHVGTLNDCHPRVIDYFRQQNAVYYNRLLELITPEELGVYLKSQEIGRVTVLSECVPRATGVVANEVTGAWLSTGSCFGTSARKQICYHK